MATDWTFEGTPIGLEVRVGRAGVYAWYFREVPDTVPTGGCLQAHGLALLYVGIAPRHPPTSGAHPSGQTLRHRLRNHYRGNAAGSTLRLTLGVLLGLELRRVGSGKRMTFAAHEQDLSAWMAENAWVAWIEHAEPWALEARLLREISLPLNLDQNHHHPFHATLTVLRRDAKARA